MARGLEDLAALLKGGREWTLSARWRNASGMRAKLYRRGGMPRGLVLAMIALALLVRITVPPGWMPAATGFGIMFCSGAGDAGMRMAGDGLPYGKHHPPAKPVPPCAFSGLATPLTQPERLEGPLAPPAPASPVALSRAIASRVGAGLAAPPPPPTGPPTPSS